MSSSHSNSALTLSRVQRNGGKGMIARFFAMLDLSRQRRQLAQLDDALLRDIGLTRHEALLESKRSVLDDGVAPKWDAPLHWLQRVALPR